jgi:uncharacterized protein YqgC (DUF456 family)
MEIVIGLVIAVGVLGVVVPVLPGALLVWAAILVWSLELQTRTGWAVLVAASVAIALSQLGKYLLPHRRLRAAGVPQSSIITGGVLGIVGFFVIPVVGVVIGFVLGLFAAERLRQGSTGPAFESSKSAMLAVGLSILIELAGTLIAAVAWLTAVLAT